MDQHLVEHAISDTEHLTLLNLAPVDLFFAGGVTHDNLERKPGASVRRVFLGSSGISVDVAVRPEGDIRLADAYGRSPAHC
ncbi:hypothetical protein [Burkholderia ubonensis]|uniref:hypothetical protein n=1 Tax=Burkholderia ubonensis TaxID=101571 RepID=UPI0009B35BFE|nr:hypothetical protein [Burkholderia ubonensis]